MCDHPYTPVAMPLLATEDHTPIDRTFRFGCTLAPQPGRFMEVSLPGIGDWTAQYVAMRALGYPDPFPSGDLGLQ